MAKGSENSSEGSFISGTDSSESCITSRDFPQIGLISVSKDTHEYVHVQHRFYNSLNSFVPHCPLAMLRRVVFMTQLQKEWCENYKQHSGELKKKRSRCANEVLAWYEASIDEIVHVVRNGFDVSEMTEDSSYCGIGLHLTPEWLSIKSLLSSPVDRNGFRHVLLCRVSLGSIEEVRVGSSQSKPSCEDYDCGVDNLKSPTKYVVWYSNANKCVLPCYVLTVKVSLCRTEICRETKRQPTSPWIPFRNLIKVLSASFPPPKMSEIKRVHSQFMERKIDRSQLIHIIRRITGDRPLLEAIKFFQEREQHRGERARNRSIFHHGSMLAKIV